MSRVLAIIIIALFLINCQSTPVGEMEQDENPINQAIELNQFNNCLSNNQSDECALVLKTIDFDLPDLNCDPYELVVEVETSFFTPAGLELGSTSRIDWEFFPKGNAGFWLVDLEQSIPANSNGIISMSGCFTYGDQTTLRLTRSIIDHHGNISNELSIDVEDPTPSKVITGTSSKFEFAASSITTN